MKRIYHPYTKWEEYHAGMWRDLPHEEEEDFLKKAIKFTGNAELYGNWMLKVVEQWKYSCEQNLSDTSINRQAWVGHAACCLAIGCPEHITRRAWHCLSQEQQDEANKKADEAIERWEKMQYEKISTGKRVECSTIQSVLGI